MGKKTYILLLNFLLILFLISNVKSQYDWNEYGNSFNPLWNAQFENSYGRLDYQLTNISMGNGQDLSFNDFSYQPLEVYINISSGIDNYLIIQNGNYIQIYDKDLNLESETFVGALRSNLDTLFFTNDTTKRNIAGVYNINSTALSLKIFTYNHTTNNLTKSFEYNFSTTDNTSISGLRHLGRNLIFTNTQSGYSQFMKVNETDGLIIKNISGNPGSRFISPLAFVDMDNDGNLEYMTFNLAHVFVFREDGTTIMNINSSNINDAKFYAPDCTISWWEQWFSDNPTCVSTWKLGVLTSTSSLVVGNTYNLMHTITAYKTDSSTLWAKTFINQQGSITSIFETNGRLAITNDYDGDTKNDIYAYFFAHLTQGITTDRINLYVIKGSNGNLLENYNYTFNDLNTLRLKSLTIADLNFDGYDDFLTTYDNRVLLANPRNWSNPYVDDNVSFSSNTVCIPADSNLDSFLEAVCIGDTSTVIFSSGLINNNSFINSVTYDSGTTIQVNETLFSIVSASDPELNIIKYNVKCSNDVGWGIEQTSNILTCSYGTIGTYNLTVGVKDDYHTNYNTYSTNIQVTLTGTSCNNNGLCESGENYLNCPNDCSQPTSNQTTIQVTGGTELPTKLVDVDNVDQGLLPTIYYSIIGFFSASLIPFIFLIFGFMATLIIITIFAIVKGLMQKAFK